MSTIRHGVGDVVIVKASQDPWTGCKVRIVELIDKWPNDVEVLPGIPLITYYTGKPVAACKVMSSSVQKPRFPETAIRVFLHKQLIPFG